MAITINFGFDGDLTEDQISTWAQYLGGPLYNFGGNGDWKVTDAAGDRAVQVAAGWGYGKGVLSFNGGPVSVQSSAVSSGSRWDLIAARRDWSTNTTVFTVVEGTATRQIPAPRTSRLNGVGNTDDQPLALVRYTAGQTEPQEILDLRVINGLGRDLLAFVDPKVGDEARVGVNGTYLEYVRDFDGVGNPAWLQRKRFANLQGVGYGGVFDIVGITTASPNAQGDWGLNLSGIFSQVLHTTITPYATDPLLHSVVDATLSNYRWRFKFPGGALVTNTSFQVQIRVSGVGV